MQRFKINPDVLPKIMFFFSIIAISFAWGLAAEKYNIFPRKLITEAGQYARELLFKAEGKKDWYYQPTDRTEPIVIHDRDAIDDGLTLLTGVKNEGNFFVRIIDIDGNIIHEWHIDWFEIWPDANHIPKELVPKSRPGTHIHGAELMPNGDIVFNFDGLGLVRMDACGNVVWKLAELTHHSVFADEEGYLWVPCYYYYDKKHKPGFPYLKPEFRVSRILKVSPDGQVVAEIPVLDVFKHNDLESYLILTSKARWNVHATGDITHLNDVKIFPTSMQEGVFKHGDVMISLRNLNTIIVFDPNTLDVRYIKTSGFTRQHDPDFIDGNTISVYDNNILKKDKKPHHSRIVLVDARRNNTTVFFQGTKEHPFYSAEMGKHQWLANGNVLIAETVYGRALEVDPEGNIVWEYINLLGDGTTGIVEEATRISSSFNKAFFEKRMVECQ